MRRLFPTELVFQVFALLASFILVHGYYVAVVRPSAEAYQLSERAKASLDPSYEIPQSIFVILRDYEQEACVVLMFWALAILGYKAVTARRQRRQLDFDLVGLPEGTPVTLDSAQKISSLIRERLPAAEQGYLLPRAILAAIDRFAATRSVQDASSVVHTVCDAEAGRMDSDLSIIRYIAWAIPSLGFIGTVRGIGGALTQINKAIAGDTAGVVDALGTAFNSTLVALLISMVLMFVIHHLQTAQEQLVLDTRRYCDDWLVRRLQA
ncbi:MAG: MotA/TolQ/ExbB proton channel family protein [Alphaproteobacteria bacterium]|nr:MotA/TolQ/ExbB proton channel family protein [Alphaproteobacteria bacterium]